MFKIKNFMIGSTNNDRRTSHDGETNDLTHGDTRSKQTETIEKRANKTTRVKLGRGKQEANGK